MIPGAADASQTNPVVQATKSLVYDKYRLKTRDYQRPYIRETMHSALNL